MKKAKQLMDKKILELFLINKILKNDLSDLSLSNWKAMLFSIYDLTEEYLCTLMDTAINCSPKWRMQENYKKHLTELLLSFNSPDNKRECLNYEVWENTETGRLLLRIPEYLIDDNFKKYHTKIDFGSLPFNKIELITYVFGNFIEHMDGVMSYLKVDNMCIYCHKYIEVVDDKINYMNKYILEPFKRFDANEMLIYEIKENYNFIDDFNSFITNKYTDEMFNKNFIDLNENELILLKMRLI